MSKRKQKRRLNTWFTPHARPRVHAYRDPVRKDERRARFWRLRDAAATGDPAAIAAFEAFKREGQR